MTALDLSPPPWALTLAHATGAALDFPAVVAEYAYRSVRTAPLYRVEVGDGVDIRAVVEVVAGRVYVLDIDAGAEAVGATIEEALRGPWVDVEVAA